MGYDRSAWASAADHAHAPIFIHSMWRTGSTFILSQYNDDPRFLPFYEPFNMAIISRRKRVLEEQIEHRRSLLRHPSLTNGYFRVYDSIDPLTGRPLARLLPPHAAIHDMWNGLDEETIPYLSACIRVAASQGKAAVFGFCRSGVQTAAMQARFGGTHVHLYRDARKQFVSYDPLGNDYFMSATAVSLLASRHWRGAAERLSATLAGRGRLIPSAMLRRQPLTGWMKLARHLWRRMSLEEMYRLFYLSWLIVEDHVATTDIVRFSTASLRDKPDHRRRVEELLRVPVEDLRRGMSAPAALPLDWERLEHQVRDVSGLRLPTGTVMHGSAGSRALAARP